MRIDPKSAIPDPVALGRPLTDDEEMDRARKFLGTEAILVEPLIRTSAGWYRWVGFLLIIMAWAAVAWIYQMRQGLGVTGLNRPVYWGVYIINFVFFIGISHAGTLISAILRICRAEWRRAITRSAEVITVMVICFGVAHVLIDLGRIDRMLNVLLHANFRSPLLWDVCSITLYLIGSSVYLYLPLIPDIAILRDTLTRRRWLYRPLALGWTGTPRQHLILDRIISAMAIFVLPLAISVHTVVSFVFAMTVQPMWHSAIFGPYFVVGAIFSGIGAILTAMVILRRVFRLEEYFRPVHFNYLGILLLVMSCLWAYFTGTEFLTVFYGQHPEEMAIFHEKLFGRFGWAMWSMLIFCFVIPFGLMCRETTRSIRGCFIASISVNIGMWLERYIIVVPSLAYPRLPYERGFYTPSWVEFAIFAGCWAAFLLLYTIFTKFFPIVSIWEVREGREVLDERGIEGRLRTYLPESGLEEEHAGHHREDTGSGAAPVRDGGALA